MSSAAKAGGPAAFTRAFVAISSKHTFLLITYWYAGLLNYLVPSGGSEWAITAPYLIEAAKQLGVTIPKTVVTDASDCWQRAR
ncbi:MAG: TIGR00366 family protein [Bacillota bacterium]|nr:TIGR00366 family protein [Bacillota bacterium]